ncbi:MAG: CaiB/BaiF CoA-transferase family protein [Actinomycetota bacterium]|nr:CaiB/BaiF CoA-transferase family protein [Actinomycetota bacterium]
MPQPDVIKPAPTSGPAKGPLDGITIIDLSWHLAGPYGMLILADLGARIIKVEAPGSHGGYDQRGFLRHYHKGQDAHYMSLNRNKESVTLNLKTEKGRELFLKLVADADVVFNNFRAGVMKRLGLEHEALVAVNPKIISVSLSSFGQDGPYAQRPGVDVVVQALSGGMSMTGEPGRPPVRAGLPIGDLAGGMWSAIAVLSALRGRDEGLNGGVDIDLALLDGQMAMIPYFSAYYFLDGSVPGPQGSGGHSPTYGAFRCADNRYLVIAVIDQGPWAKLCSALGRTDLIEDPRFASSERRANNGDELRALIETEFASLPLDEWEVRLEAADLAYARVNRLDEALADPVVHQRNMVIEIEHSLGDTLRFVGNPVKFPAFPARLESPPLIGEDTDAVLTELGLGPDELQALRSAGVI